MKDICYIGHITLDKIITPNMSSTKMAGLVTSDDPRQEAPSDSS